MVTYKEIGYLGNLGLDGSKIFRYVSKKDVSYEVMNYIHLRVISGFPREVDKNCAILFYYAACSRNSLPTFRDDLFPLHAA